MCFVVALKPVVVFTCLYYREVQLLQQCYTYVLSVSLMPQVFGTLGIKDGIMCSTPLNARLGFAK